MEKTNYPICCCALLAFLASSSTPTLAATQRVQLQPGWNLVALQVEPTNPAISQVLAPAAASIDQVWMYDALAVPPLWLGYQPQGSVSTLSEIHASPAYWFHVLESEPEPVFIEVIGEPIENVFLTAGWNLVGSYGGLSLPIASASTSLPDGSEILGFDSVQGWLHFDSSAPPFLQSLFEIGPKKGYWVFVEQDTLWGGPQLAVTAPANMRFGVGPQVYVLKIENIGSGILEWNVESSQPWVTFDDSHGSIKGDQIDVVVVGVDWSLLPIPGSEPQEYSTEITVDSTGGSQSFPITAVAMPVEGHYRGGASLSSVNNRATSLPNVNLAMDIKNDGELAVLTVEGTPFFPNDAFFAGFRSGEKLVLGTSFHVAANDPASMNMFGHDLVRTVTLQSRTLANGRISGDLIGDYTETIEFPAARPIVIRGTFVLTRVGPLDGPPPPDQAAKTFRPDKDADGMPDDWEIQYALNFGDAADALFDPDGDTINNLNEYWRRTNPRLLDAAAPVEPTISGTILETGSNAPVAGVTVTLHFGNRLLTAMTDASGNYHFGDLVPGYHEIAFGPYPGFTFSPSRQAIVLARAALDRDVMATRESTLSPIDFVGSPLEGDEPLKVQFVTLKGPSGLPQNTVWFFGDGGSSTARDPVHIYTVPGQYTVELLSSFGTVNKGGYVRVGDPRGANFRLAHGVHSLEGGHVAAGDLGQSNAPTRLVAVVGTTIGENERSESQNYAIRVGDVP